MAQNYQRYIHLAKSAATSGYRRLPQSKQVKVQRLAYKAGTYNTKANRRAAAMGITAVSASGLTYKGVRLTPKARQPRGKINYASLGTHPASSTLRPTSVRYKSAKIRGARTLGPIPLVARWPGTGKPILGYKKHAAFVHGLRRSGPKKTRRPLTRGEYSTIRSSLSKQSNIAYKHRLTYLGRKDFHAARKQLASVNYRRSYLQPTSKVVYRARRVRRDSQGRFAGSY